PALQVAGDSGPASSGRSTTSTINRNRVHQGGLPEPGAAGPQEGGWKRQSYQAEVQRVVVIFGHGQVHGQGHTVGKDGEQDDRLEGPGARVKESL
ncbi:hypothetical protein P7K49_035656, partial [Saguinus oedipus]